VAAVVWEAESVYSMLACLGKSESTPKLTADMQSQVCLSTCEAFTVTVTVTWFRPKPWTPR